jgi:hypothetical protein
MDYYEILKEIYEDVLKVNFDFQRFQSEFDNYLKNATEEIDSLCLQN